MTNAQLFHLLRCDTVGFGAFISSAARKP
jgi:hypothetical protein